MILGRYVFGYCCIVLHIWSIQYFDFYIVFFFQLFKLRISLLRANAQSRCIFSFQLFYFFFKCNFIGLNYFIDMNASQCISMNASQRQISILLFSISINFYFELSYSSAWIAFLPNKLLRLLWSTLLISGNGNDL